MCSKPSCPSPTRPRPSPRVRAPEAQALLSKRVNEFNTIINGYIEGFKRRHPHMNVLTFDAYTWFNEVLDNAGQYGFTDTTGYVTFPLFHFFSVWCYPIIYILLLLL